MKSTMKSTMKSIMKSTGRKTVKAKASAPLSVKAPAESKSQLAPSFDEIARRSYELYLARGGRQADPGHEVEDWLRAEAELLSP
jgi:hypothetical protein